MAEIWDNVCYFYILIFCYFSSILCRDTFIEYNEDKKPCTYFESTRVAQSEGGLVNCSWYAHSSCCKRTEVTSVFSSNMLPLYRASQACHNRINYIMCYFCSPDQYHWYKEGKVHICETFCRSIYSSCKDAFYNGTKIDENYGNGTAFCEAQNFRVVNSKYCFKYDPTVFDTASNLQHSYSKLYIPLIVGLFNKVFNHV